ncbi:MAG TPA: ATP-binding protein [Armatimonadota bacterium]|nr:ATP-binding protein [Armatimonadota bacterium]
MFSTDIRNMSDAELSSAIKALIEDHEPESLRLDYKETLDISKDSGKKELAKDVSSFANEQGGVLVYGVPEARDGELPRPKPLAECGMEIDPGLPESIERILISTVQPPLHALTIRVVDLPEIAPKQLLIIQHPESYWKPHMIEGYGVRRYYRRGNFQAVIMNEREVEAAYLARESARAHVRDFLRAASFGNHPGTVLRATACPVLRGQFKEMLLHPGITNWLSKNAPFSLHLSMQGDWAPFLDGWRFLGTEKGNISGKLYEMRVFHNGAICLNMDVGSACVFDGFLGLSELRDYLPDLFLRSSERIFRALGVAGPLILQVCLTGARGLGCVRDDDEFRRLSAARNKISNGERSVRFNRHFYDTLEELEKRYQDGDQIVFEEESSVSDIQEQPEAVVDRLISRLGMAFGVWG